MNPLEKINRIISDSDLCILYNPGRLEIDPKILPFTLPDKQVSVPTGPDTDPKFFGKNLKDEFTDLKAFMLIPGRRFDKFGGRHGKGHGWYDRFLSTVPSQWIRIGICYQNQFSETKLNLQTWDEVVDWIIVKHDNGYLFYETNTRG